MLSFLYFPFSTIKTHISLLGTSNFSRNIFSCEPIGLRVDGKFPVKVRSIVKDSFFDGWNQEHVEEGVKEGDWIHSIDGVVVDAGDIRVEDVAVLHNDIYKNLAVAQYIAFFRPISPSDTFSIILHREYLLLGVSSGILR